MTVASGAQPAADPTTAAGAVTAGQDTQAPAPTQATQQQQQQPTQAPAAETAEPLFVAKNQDELNAKFGQTREEGRLAVAKANGFDTVEAFNTAIQSWKSAHDASLTDQQKAEQAQQEITRERDALKIKVAAQAMKDEQTRIAATLGIDPAKLDRVEKYRDKNPAEIGPDGTVNATLLEHSMSMFLAANPEFKAPATTVGVTGQAAEAAGGKTTLDQQITEAQNKGQIEDAISLQLQKMFQPAI